MKLLRANEGLALTDERPIKLLGLAGIQVDVVASHPDTEILGDGTALLGIGPEVDLRLILLPGDDGVTAVGLLSPVGELERWTRQSGAAVESILLAP